MARNLTAGVLTAVLADFSNAFLLCEALFDVGPLRLWTGYGPLVTLGQTWTGSGELLGISPVVESAALKATKFEFTLSGVPSSILDKVEDTDYQGRVARLYLGFLDSAGLVIPTPYQLRELFMDVLTDKDDGVEATVKLSCEDSIVALQRPKEFRYTDEDQQAEFPGDKFFEFVPDLQEKAIEGRTDGT